MRGLVFIFCILMFCKICVSQQSEDTLFVKIPKYKGAKNSIMLQTSSLSATPFTLYYHRITKQTKIGLNGYKIGFAVTKPYENGLIGKFGGANVFFATVEKNYMIGISKHYLTLGYGIMPWYQYYNYIDNHLTFNLDNKRMIFTGNIGYRYQPAKRGLFCQAVINIILTFLNDYDMKYEALDLDNEEKWYGFYEKNQYNEYILNEELRQVSIKRWINVLEADNVVRGEFWQDSPLRIPVNIGLSIGLGYAF